VSTYAFADKLEVPDGTPYMGLWLAPIPEGGPLHTVRLRTAREGSMLEFVDPDTGKCVGSCGRNWAEKWVKQVGHAG
jgi:hypothetical protein